MKIFITNKLPGNIEGILKKEGFKVFTRKSDLPVTKEEIIKNAKDADALISLLTDTIDREVIEKLKKCKIIANAAAGYNNIDVKCAAERNIIVTNTPGILTDATADLSMALLLAVARRIPEGESIMRNDAFKGWNANLLLGIELRNKVLGIIGPGRIGRGVAIRARAFGMKIIYYGRNKNSLIEKETGAKKVALDKLLSVSDFVSLHAPLNKETFHLLNSENMRLMKKSAVLINTSRGELIDEKILIKMLKGHKIYAAGLDVFENEPKINPELRKLSNVVLLPHIGSATLETRSGMAELAALNVINVLKGKGAKTPIIP